MKSWERERAAIDAAFSSLQRERVMTCGDAVDEHDVRVILRDLYRNGKRDQYADDAPHMKRPETLDEKQTRIDRMYGRKPRAGS